MHEMVTCGTAMATDGQSLLAESPPPTAATDAPPGAPAGRYGQPQGPAAAVPVHGRVRLALHGGVPHSPSGAPGGGGRGGGVAGGGACGGTRRTVGWCARRALSVRCMLAA